MNELEAIRDGLLRKLPTIDYDYDPAETESGSSWLDLHFEEQYLNIEWKPNKGFGLYFQDQNSYGTGPEEIYRSKDKLLKRIYMLFLEHKLRLKLKEIREIKGVSQTELGALLGQNQGSISKLESRESDVLFKTLCSVVKALGGKLEVKAHFDDFDVPLDFSCTNDENHKPA